MNKSIVCNPLVGKASEQELIKTFGYSKTFTKSATYAFKDDQNTSGYPPKGLFNTNNLDAANHVAGCGYEISTTWGSKVFFFLHIIIMFWLLKFTSSSFNKHFNSVNINKLRNSGRFRKVRFKN